MSLILEALRKSEAERRRGQTPDLLSDAAPVAPATRGTTQNRNVVLAVIGAALVTLLLVVWWLRASVQPEPVAAVNEQVEAATPAPSTSPTDTVASQSQRSLSPPVANAQGKAPPAPTTPPVATPAQSPAPVATTEAAPQADTSPSPVEPIPPPPPQVASSEPKPAASAPAFASPDVPLKLSDLSTEERQQLPALKVSMHMWAPDAANRFAIIDGTRVNEGDRLGDATIEAIQPDSVMLSWRGRHIRLPIR